jgi:hypothetical protein
MLWLAVEKPRAWSNTIVILACISAVVFYALYTWVSRDRLHASRPSYSVVQPVEAFDEPVVLAVHEPAALRKPPALPSGDWKQQKRATVERSPGWLADALYFLRCRPVPKESRPLSYDLPTEGPCASSPPESVRPGLFSNIARYDAILHSDPLDEKGSLLPVFSER